MNSESLQISRGQCWINRDVARRFQNDALSDLIETAINRDTNSPIFKEDHRSIVHRAEHGGESWVVKTYRTPRAKTSLYRLFRATPAWREWRASQKLVRAGIRTNPPLAMVYDPARGEESQILVFPYIAGVTVHQFLKDDGEQNIRRHLARAIGQQAGRMIAAGVVNRDHKPSNLIIDDACANGEHPPVIIDPLGVRTLRRDRQVYRMLSIMIHTFVRSGRIRPTEAMVALKEVLRANPSFAPGPQRLKTVARRVIDTLEDDQRKRVLSADS